MSLDHYFGIIENFDTNKDYTDIDEFGTFPDTYPNALKAYNCVGIHDFALNDWWPRIKDMKVYFHKYSRPATALARYGVTLIPPESLDLFYDIVGNNTISKFKRQIPVLFHS